MRGLNKPSANTVDPQKSTVDETIKSEDKRNVDENGMTFLADSFYDIY